MNKQFVSEVRTELTEHILPFWLSLRDNINGGYIGLVDFDLVRHPGAVKGCILNSRILWTFSEAYLLLGDGKLRSAADHAFSMLCRMTDERNGGVYWSLTADGQIADSTKHTYNQAFAVYALSAYHRATGSAEALERAFALFDVIESHCCDEGGYLEAFTEDWRPESNEKLSENGVMAERTMNTLLHLLEGYTGLYKASKDIHVRERLLKIFSIWEQYIYNPVLRRQEVFFDRGYHSLIDLHSFGHDIETSWLADQALDILDDEELTARIRPKLLDLADHTLSAAFTEQGFVNESEHGRVDETRVWWVQAEALLGFLNAWEHTRETRYLDATLSQWTYIKNHMIDKRPDSEWFWSLGPDGTPNVKPIVEPWKCPYHNGRMAMEVLRRAEKYRKDFV
jgi:mannobiose 2-epimerase